MIFFNIIVHTKPNLSLKSIISYPNSNNSAREPHTLHNQLNNKNAPRWGIFII